MLHVAFLANGRDYHVPRWLRALAEQGVQISLLTLAPPEEPLPGITVVRLDPGRVGYRWLAFHTMAPQVRRWLGRNAVDVLVASYATSNGWLAQRTGFRPFVAFTWTLDVSYYPLQGWRRFFFRPIVDRVLRAASAITTDGAALAEVVRSTFAVPPDKVTALQWGIRLADYAPSPTLRAGQRAAMGIPMDAPVVVSARGIRPWYRPESTLPALLLLLDRHPEAYALVLTLGHPRTPAVQADLNALAAHPRSRVFDQFLSTETIRGIWAASDLLLSIPSHDGVSEAVLEGMYLGALPVVSDIGSNRSFLDEEAAFFVDTFAPDHLARQLAEVIADLPRHVEARQARNRAWVAQHASVEQTAARLAALLHRIAEQGA